MKRKTYSYGVNKVDLAAFEQHTVVKTFLSKYDGSSTRDKYSRHLCTFFNWLQKTQNIQLTPSQFINTHLQKRSSLSVEERRWAINYVTGFCRDNPDFKDNASNYRRLMFVCICQFFNYHEAPLSTASNILNEKVRRKYKPKDLTAERIREALGVLNQRDRTIALCLTQSGMSIGDCLNKFNYQLNYIEREIALGKERIKIEFDERKGNGFEYFTYLSRDAIQELRKWLNTRRQWMQTTKPTLKGKNAIFITRKGKPLTVLTYEVSYSEAMKAANLKTGPYDLTPHQIRKFFKTESRPPDRNIDQGYIEFMMGHSNGLNTELDSSGGIYDRSPQTHEKAVENEYEKLEPFINIYTGRTGGDATNTVTLTPEKAQLMEIMLREFR